MSYKNFKNIVGIVLCGSAFIAGNSNAASNAVYGEPTDARTALMMTQTLLDNPVEGNKINRLRRAVIRLDSENRKLKLQVGRLVFNLEQCFSEQSETK